MISPEVLEQVWLFQGVSARGRQTLLSRAVARSFAPDETLFMEGAEPRGLFVIISGRVRVVRSAGGRRHVVHTEGPGGTLGEVPIFDGGGYPATAVALEATRCVVFTPAAIQAAIAADPEVAWAVLRQMADRIRTLVDRLDARVARDTRSRLAEFLLTHRDAQTNLVHLDGSQSELAEELGTVREVVVRDLRRLRENGAIRSCGRRAYEILDVDALGRLAIGD